MNKLENICFEIISYVGMARSSYINAIKEAKNKNFDKAKILMKDGENYYIKGHLVHTNLIEKEAKGEKIYISLLLLHSEDQLMMADNFRLIADEFIEIYKALYLENK